MHVILHSTHNFVSFEICTILDLADDKIITYKYYLKVLLAVLMRYIQRVAQGES